MSLIDANVLIEKEKPMDSITHGMVMAVQSEHILEAPTVDAVEVVRCKDCKGWCAEKVAEAYGVPPYCTVSGYLTKPDDFCSYGERKEA